FSGLQSLEVDAEHAAAEVVAIDWNDGKAWTEKMSVLEKLRKDIHALPDRRATERVAPRYLEAARRAFLDSGRRALEDALRDGSGVSALEERATLKQYLLLNDRGHLETEGAWQTTHLTKTCALALSATSSGTIGDAEALHAMLKPHVSTLIFLVETGVVA